MAFKTLEEASKAFRLAHTQVKNDVRLATDDGQTEEVYALYEDIMQDLEKMKSMLGTVGCPRSAAIINDAIVKVDSCKAILEEECAQPR